MQVVDWDNDMPGKAPADRNASATFLLTSSSLFDGALGVEAACERVSSCGTAPFHECRGGLSVNGRRANGDSDRLLYSLRDDRDRPRDRDSLFDAGLGVEAACECVSSCGMTRFHECRGGLSVNGRRANGDSDRLIYSSRDDRDRDRPRDRDRRRLGRGYLIIVRNVGLLSASGMLMRREVERIWLCFCYFAIGWEVRHDLP